ncbi:NADPH-dependent FMN reductase [Ochrobactrum soli]|uniref:NADPH-dependent FMN reductase domain protein n=1 Tax=Ochrobactrum soli TaxID=2448455 RepID=A0A2P9HF41_9HYPH|nr:NAD(P)H-dependent oxidoreductase [[Ochrobactrum] soli]SPL62716.1 NADPH-dependent FMN reductase domain protein [[Ochrobactrum] soli]
MPQYTVATFVGSLRKASFNHKIAQALSALAPETLTLEIVEIGDLPFYNQDLDDEGAPPESWLAFREKVKPFDAVLFVTPEYNRSVPAVLKNALDVGSRPYGKSIWDGKPGAVVSVSPGGLSAFGANHHLRQSLVCLNVPTLQQPEAYLGHVAGLLDDDGKLSNADTHQFLSGFLVRFADWIDRNHR